MKVASQAANNQHIPTSNKHNNSTSTNHPKQHTPKNSKKINVPKSKVQSLPQMQSLSGKPPFAAASDYQLALYFFLVLDFWIVDASKLWRLVFFIVSVCSFRFLAAGRTGEAES